MNHIVWGDSLLGIVDGTHVVWGEHIVWGDSTDASHIVLGDLTKANLTKISSVLDKAASVLGNSWEDPEVPLDPDVPVVPDPPVVPDAPVEGGREEPFEPVRDR